MPYFDISRAVGDRRMIVDGDFATKRDCVQYALDSRARLDYADLSGLDLHGMNFAGRDLSCVRFHGCNLRDADFSDATLDCAQFEKADLTGAKFIRASLNSAHLEYAILRGTDMSGADIDSADFSGTMLSEAILPEGLEIPLVRNIDRQILDMVNSDRGELDMGHWHRCDSTHCRAGWAVHLAGTAGYALEEAVGAAAAGALIYTRSRPGKPVPDFYCSNDVAMADIIASAG